MPSTATDRLNGILTSTAVKPPCRVATTANITLAGLQTVNGVALADGDRVLVKDQTDTTANGIYVASTSAWSRATDFDGTRDVVNGTLVVVCHSDAVGVINIYQAVATDPVVIGTSAITFMKVTNLTLSAVETQTATAGQTLFTLTDVSYVPGANDLAVFANGLRLVSGVDYTETSSTSVTLLSAAAEGDEFLFSVALPFNVNMLASAVGYTPAGTGAVPTNVQVKLRERITLKDFATGDGTTNDGAKSRLAVASFPATGGVLRLPRATYVVDATGGKCLPITAPINLTGDGGIYTAINPSSAASTDDTVSISPSAVDHTLTGIEKLHIGNPNTGTRTGRYGVFADTQTAGRNLPKYTIRDVVVGQGSNFGFYHLNNAANNVNGGLYCSLFQNNQIKGGIKLENSGDSISILHNILSGTGHGVNATLVPGASLLEIQSNNITTTYGAINIGLGSRFRILGNNIEHSAVGAVANNNAAVIDINGASGLMYGGVIKENLVSAFGSTDATTLIRLRNCRGTLVEDNVLLSGGGATTTAIDIDGSNTDIRIGANTFNGIANKVVDGGVGTMGVVKAGTLANGWVAFSASSDAFGYIKSTDGIVHVWGSIKDGTTVDGTQIMTMPEGFRPAAIVRTPAFTHVGGVTSMAEIAVDSATGAVSINYAEADQFTFNFSYPAANLANAVSLE